MKSSLPIIALCFALLHSNAFADNREGVASGGGGGNGDAFPSVVFYIGYAMVKCPGQAEKAHLGLDETSAPVEIAKQLDVICSK